MQFASDPQKMGAAPTPRRAGNWCEGAGWHEVNFTSHAHSSGGYFKGQVR